MKRRAISAALVAVLTALLVESFAPCAERPRVLLVGRSEKDPTVTRLAEELRVLGLDIAFAADPPNAPEHLATLAREKHAAAAARVEGDPPAIVLWMNPSQSPAGDETAGAEIRFDQSLIGSKDTGLLALRAIEVLRGWLVPVDRAPPIDASIESSDAIDAGPLDAAIAQANPLMATPPLRETAGFPSDARTGSAISAFAGPAVALSPGGVSPSVDVILGARWAPNRHLELEIIGVLPATAPTVSAAEGTMALRAYVIAGGIGAVLAPVSSRAFGSLGLGLGAMRLAFQGDANSPFRSADGGAWAALPYARAGAGVAFSSAFALRADMLVGLARPMPALRMAGDQIASFGDPLVLFDLAVEARP